MGYYIDLKNITINAYRNKLESAYLPPSRMILKDQLDERFEYFQSIGIENTQELIQTLKKKGKIEELQKVEHFSDDYLKILLRELNSILPKPNKINEFPRISSDAVIELEKLGIKNTLKLYDKIKTKQSRKELTKTTGISESIILELAKLTDLSRIKWVGVKFARMLLDLGFDSVEKASKADPNLLHIQINKISKEKNFYKGHIGLNDIKIFVEAAKEVPITIEY